MQSRIVRDTQSAPVFKFALQCRSRHFHIDFPDVIEILIRCMIFRAERFTRLPRGWSERSGYDSLVIAVPTGDRQSQLPHALCQQDFLSMRPASDAETGGPIVICQRVWLHLSMEKCMTRFTGRDGEHNMDSVRLYYDGIFCVVP